MDILVRRNAKHTTMTIKTFFESMYTPRGLMEWDWKVKSVHDRDILWIKSIANLIRTFLGVAFMNFNVNCKVTRE